MEADPTVPQPSQDGASVSRPRPCADGATVGEVSGVPAASAPVTAHVAYEAELRYGYTLASLNDLAVQAVRVQRYNRQVDFTVRVELAWSAMAEFLYTAEQPPAPEDLVRAAWAEISDDTDRNRRAHGWSTHDRYAGVTNRFRQYWIGAGHHTSSPEEPVVERVALAQIWPRLRPSHRQLLLAMAVHEDHELAAKALDKTRKSFTTQLGEARRAFLALWHQGEQPSRPWGADRRKSADSMDRHSATYVIRQRERRRQARIAAHGEPPPPRVRTGKTPTDLGITAQELARRYQQAKSIRALAGSLGVSYGVLQRRLQAEGIVRQAALTDEVRHRKRRQA